MAEFDYGKAAKAAHREAVKAAQRGDYEKADKRHDEFERLQNRAHGQRAQKGR